MKSPVVLNIIIAALLAVVAYFVVPQSDLESHVALASGLLIGGIVIPFISSLFTGTPSSSVYEDDEEEGQTLYVGNLPYRANEQAVSDHFSLQGKVLSVRLMKDRRTGKRKGYGFVEMARKDADRAIQKLNDSEFQERTLKVRLAKEKVTEE